MLRRQMPERALPTPGHLSALPCFGMVLGLGGLSNAWRAAEALWHLPSLPADVLGAVSTACWLLSWWQLYAGLRSAPARARNPAALGEPLVALVPMSTLVVSLVLNRWNTEAARALFAVAALAQVAVGVECTARLWRAEPPSIVSSISLMPTVGGFFVAALAAATFDFAGWGRLLFGAALLSWLVTESVVLARLMTGGLEPRLRSTLGVHVTPPAIASVAWLALDAEHALLAQLLFGYALFQMLVLLRLTAWLRQQSFAMTSWAYTFGASALSVAALRFALRGSSEVIASLAAPVFVGANVLIGWMVLRTLALTRRAPPIAVHVYHRER
jgi:tellurite resistance protein